MLRAAAIPSRSVKYARLPFRDRFTRNHPPDALSTFTCCTHQRHHFSSTPSSSESTDDELGNSRLQQVFEEIERQSMESDRLRAITNPTPWFNLLRYPGRAAWRSSDHLFDIKDKDRTSPLAQTQFNLIQKSGRTNKQLKRTYKRIMDTHQALAIKRERERRMAANFATTKAPLTDKGGNLENKEGKNVGSWKERSNTPTTTCDDPSVSLLLSQSSAKFKLGLEVNSGSKAKNIPTEEVNAMYRSKRKSKIISSAATATSGGNATDKPVGYGPEHVMTNLKYRFGPNYSIVRRVLLEVQSLLGGTPKMDGQSCFRPKRVLDYGCGVGSSSAAALDVFGVPRTTSDKTGIEWIHSIDASQSMRDATEGILKSVLEGAPWGYDENQETVHDAEMEHYEQLVKEIKGTASERALERQRKRLEKWEQSWERQTDYRTRLTFGESIVDSSSFYSLQSQKSEEPTERPDLPWQKQLDEQRQKIQEKKQSTTSQKGSFDLILCTYTLSELNSVSSTLTAAALLWEKLAADGIMVFVEPGTPDGFSTLRSVRSMLLECAAPREIRHLRYMERKRSLLVQIDVEQDETVKEALRLALEELEKGRHDWDEECQVIAPCTHNGLCPMSRHQKNHVKRNTRFGKYETASDSDENYESAGAAADKLIGSDDGIDIDELALTKTNPNLSEEEEEEQLMRELIEQGYSREHLEEMMQLMEGLQDDDDDTSDDSDNEFDLDEEEGGDDFFELDPNDDDNVASRPKSTMSETNVFGSAFCSFVHSFPGGTTRKKGEKFSYLVVQKRTPDSSQTTVENDALSDIDIVDILAKSSYHVQGLKRELLQMAKRKKVKLDDESYRELNENSVHARELRHLLDEAVQIEDQFLDSNRDSLGMELVHGRSKGWGRLVRAPIKKKGHILLDYCSGGYSGCSQLDGTSRQQKGRIIRQKVSRGWSARVAPGCYAAARKSRWGGLWPDLSQRVP
ncbi:hypothetical protein ACHAXN_003331 [Cyclotella atomus]